MRDAVIVAAVRTPVGKRNGGLSGVHPVDLSAHVLKALAERTGIDPAVVDDVVWGCVSQVGEQTFDIARNAVLGAGWPESVPGVTVDRQCGSSQQAVHFAAAGVVSGQYDVVVAGGVESMSRVPMGSSLNGALPFGEGFRARYDGVFPNQGIGAEMVAERWNLSRAQLDEYSLASHEKAAAAQDEGGYDEQIVPVTPPDGTVVTQDEGIRRGGTLETLAQAQAGVQAGRRDHRREQLADHRRLGRAAHHDQREGRRARADPAGAHPHRGAGRRRPGDHADRPDPGHAKALHRSGLSIDQIGVAEVNEAFAPVPLAWLAELGADPKVLNPNGGAIALGHPLGGSGARAMTTLVYRMRDHGTRYGLQTMCEGGGQANATILECSSPSLREQP